MAIPNTYTTSGSDPSNVGVYPMEWESKLQERLNKPVTYKEVCKVMYSDTYGINSPYMSTEFSAQTGTRGCSYSFSEFTLTNDQLLINQFSIVPVFIDRADLSQCTLANQAEMATRQGALLEDIVETAVLAGHAGWTDFDNSSIGGAAGNITVSTANIDNIIRSVKREIAENNAQELADRNGTFIIWRAADMEKLEEFAQANGFVLADKALKNGIESGYHFMGMDHYISNSHTANHLFGGVKKVMNVGILSGTYGKITILQSPASGVTTYGPVSGIGIEARVDYGVNTPTGLSTAVFDISVA